METITDSININEERRVFFTNQYIINSIHTPFIGYQQQGDQLIIVSEKLNDDHRFLNLGNNFFNKENIAPYFNRAVDELLIWLSQNCWKNNFVHGDLTDDNMILRFGTDGLPHICIIDWFDFGYYHTGDEAIYRILLDIFDVLYLLDMTTGNVSSGATVLRDATANAATYNSGTGVISNYTNSFAIQAGYDIEFKSYLLGDIDGDFASLI